MSVNIVGREKDHALPDASFFHPRAFETLLTTYFNDRFGHRQWDNGVARHWGPAEWQVHDHLPVFSANCKIYNQNANGSKSLSPRQLLFFPITKEHFVEISMRQDIYSLDEHLNPAFDTAPIQALQDAILNSVTLELSPEAQADYQQATTEAGSATLTRHFPPLRWPTTGELSSHHSRIPGAAIQQS
ncbi:hypothetical protein [Marinimicrobium sp. ARAG 43.8]|uniref:hypothetical protein n=1 Tax=Marinimicrobium sp. ARAG 43.8 TaxID=3418719 RepID=UPI003CE98A1B